jgi:hypothetical protein
VSDVALQGCFPTHRISEPRANGWLRGRLVAEKPRSEGIIGPRATRDAIACRRVGVRFLRGENSNCSPPKALPNPFTPINAAASVAESPKHRSEVIAGRGRVGRALRLGRLGLVTLALSVRAHDSRRLQQGHDADHRHNHAIKTDGDNARCGTCRDANPQGEHANSER